VAQSLTKILPRVLDVLTYVGNDCKWLGSISILSVGTSDPAAQIVNHVHTTRTTLIFKNSGGKLTNPSPYNRNLQQNLALAQSLAGRQAGR
jgi:hypothetical protein